jgi:APA family basic amino acid/polyamine antiporter
MKGVISIGGLMAGRLFGKAMESLFSVLIAFALFSSLSAFIILGPRVYYSMASQGLFFKSLKKVDPTSQAPSNAILLQSLFSVIMVLSGTFDQILTFMGFSLGIFPILAVMGVFRLRKRNAGYLKMPGYPFTPLIYSLSGLAILLLAYFERPVESTISLIMVMAGIPVYFTFRRQWRQ